MPGSNRTRPAPRVVAIAALRLEDLESERTDVEVLVSAELEQVGGPVPYRRGELVGGEATVRRHPDEHLKFIRTPRLDEMCYAPAETIVHLGGKYRAPG